MALCNKGASMRTMRLAAAAAASFLVLTAAGTAMAKPAASQPVTGALVTVGSPSDTFSQNKQNEPAVAIDAHNPSVVVAGANDNIDMEACNAGDPTTCPFTPGVGSSGVYFSFDGGHSWTQPTYSGWSARDCLGPAACAPQVGQIGTLPHYFENGLVSDGDPGVAFGPRPGPGGTFAWSNPAVISKQNPTTFSDKSQIWADNASSSPFFGRVYVCWADFRSQEKGHALPVPLIVARSADGGSTWTVKQVGPATNNRINGQPDGCTIRTDSHGNVYVFGVGRRAGTSFEMMYKSTDGGAHFTGPALLSPAVDPGLIDPVLGRPVMDGVAGARNDLAFGPSVDIANGAPDGTDATNQIMLTWADGRLGLNHEQLLLMTSTDGGTSFTGPAAVPLTTGDRPYYTAPAISPNGTDVYITYNAFTTPYRTDTTSRRGLVGAVLHADVTGGAIGTFSTLARGAVGDPRASSQNDLTAEFLGDYVYTAATRTGAVGVWNDVRRAADCPALDAWRLSLRTGTSVTKPAPQVDCPPTFGNSDIFGAAVSDPTP